MAVDRPRGRTRTRAPRAHAGPAVRLVRRLPHSQRHSLKVLSRKRTSEAWCEQVLLFGIEAYAY